MCVSKRNDAMLSVAMLSKVRVGADVDFKMMSVMQSVVTLIAVPFKYIRTKVFVVTEIVY
jgi:hypothetical protein